MVAHHPEQTPALLNQMTEAKSSGDTNDDAMVIDEPDLVVAGPSTRPVFTSDNTAVLLYEDEIELST